MLKDKEYTACKNGDQTVTVGTKTKASKLANGREVTIYYLGKYKFTKMQAKKIAHALDKLVERDEAYAAKNKS